jgi:co-chaperonin GroES (HSP10)
MFKPAGYRLSVKIKEVEKVTESGIILAIDEKRERAAIDVGTVVAIGKTCWKDVGDGTPWCKEGDLVIFARNAGKFITDPDTGEDYLIVNDQDIQMVKEQ